MLRSLVLALGIIAVAVGAFLLRAGPLALRIYLACVGAAIILGTAFERLRYRNPPPVHARWESTDERFADPATGEVMEVQYDRASGERRYVRTGESAAPK